MKTKLEIINDTLEEIRDILEVPECASIEEIPSILKGVLGDPSRNGYTTVFAFSSYVMPEKPTANTLDVSTGMVTGLDEAWSQEGFKSAISTHSLRGTVEETGTNWMSFAIFGPDGTMVSNDWSEPADLKGIRGRDGKDGQIGSQGDKGDKGEPGTDGKDGSRFEYIYKLSNDPDGFDAPTSVNIDRDVPFDWTNNPSGVSDEYEYEYVCQREKVDGKWGPWSTPSIWSHFGVTGKDGNGVEYIFCLTSGYDIIPSKPISNPTQSEYPGMFPLVSGEFEWYDDPLETSETNPLCWSCVRKQKYTEGEDSKQYWGEYSDPVIWARFAKDGKEGGGRTVQCYTWDADSEANIPIPIGGAWNPETNAVTPPVCPDGDCHIWTEDMGSVPKTVKNKEGKDVKPHIWQSNMPFNSAGVPANSWSEPFRITGDNGEMGADGTSIEFIYRLLSDKDDYEALVKWHTDLETKDIAKLENTGTDEVPTKTDISDTPYEHWSPIEGTDDYTISYSDWTDSPEGIDGHDYLVEVVCSRKFDKETQTWGDWSTPTIWSMWGEDGQDGDGVEYIYLITPKTVEKELVTKDSQILKVPTIADYEAYDKLNDTNYAEQYQEKGFVPGVGNPNWISGQEWTDEPCDVSFDEPIEWVRVRKYRIHDGEIEPRWGDWSEPSKWAMWAEDGASFKTSFVFAVSSLNLSQLIPGKNLKGGNYSNPYPDPSVLQHGTNSDGSPKNYTITWTDAPRVPDVKSGEYLWSTSRTFKAGDENPDDAGSVDRYWSVPAKMSDTATFQVEFTKGQVIEGVHNPEVKPTPENFNVYYEKLRDVQTGTADWDDVEKAWRKVEADKGFVWDDYVADAVWMATSTFSNGKWSDWSVIKVKGEKGDAGDNGTSVTIEGAAVKWTDCNLPQNQLKFEAGDNAGSPIKYLMYQCTSFNDGAWTLMMWTDPDGDGIGSYQQYDSSKLYNGFGILVESNLWVWDGDSWENVGQIKGDKGDKTYLYVAHSDDPNVLSIDNLPEGVDIDDVEVYLDRVGKYIGYRPDYTERTTEFLKNANNYTWSKWIGDDGWGWEQIFLLTKHDSGYTFDNPPAKPTVSEQIADYLPEHDLGEGVAKTEKWTDLPDTPDAAYPFCWVTRRAASTNEWGTEWEPVTLYSRYVANATHLELSEDHITVPIVADESVDTEWTGADFVAYVYDGDDLRTEGVEYFYRFDTDVEFVNNDSEVFELSREAFVNHLNATKIEVKVVVTIGTNVTKEFTKTLHLTWNKSGYELNVNKHILKKSVYDGGYLIPDKDEFVTVTATLYKWDFAKNTYNPVQGRTIYVDYVSETGTVVEKAFTDKTDQSGKVIFDELRSVQNPSSFKFYVVKDGSNEIVAFEEVGVVANGEDGATEEHIFHLSKTLVTNFEENLEFHPSEWVEQDGYQNPEFVPSNTSWYDEYHNDAEQVSLEYPYCYSSARRRTKDEDAGQMMWGEFQQPVLYAKYSKDTTAAWLSKNATIVTFDINKQLSATDILTILNVKSDVEDVITEPPYISTVRLNGVELDQVDSQIVTLKSGKWGDDLSVNVELTIEQSVWASKSGEECEIEVDIAVKSKTGLHTVTHEILVIKAAGESKFSIDLTDEFHYMHYIASNGGRDEFGMPIAAYRDWPAIRAMAYYGTTMLTDPVVFIVTATDQNGIVYTLKNEVEVPISKDNTYWLEPDFTKLESWYNDNTGDVNTHYISGEVIATATINGKTCETRDTFRIQKTTIDKASLNVIPAIVNLKDNKNISWSVDLPDGKGYKVTNLPAEYSVTVTHNGIEESALNPHSVTEVGEYTFTLYCGNEIHDYEPVTVIDITNPYLLDIDPDNDWVQTKEDGTPLTTYSKTVNCRFWNGSKEVIPTYTAAPTGCTVTPTGTNGVYTVIYNGSSKEPATVIFGATYNGVTVSKTFTLHKSLGKPTYRIIAPAQLNNTVGTSFNVTVEKIDGNDTVVYTSPQAGLELYFKNTKVNSWTSLSVSSTENATELYLELRDANGVFLDGEYITLVKNGALDETQTTQINNEIKAVQDEAKANLDEAKGKLSKDLVDAKTNLETALKAEQEARESGVASAQAEAQSALAAASAQVGRLKDVEDAISVLDGYFDSNGTLKLDNLPWDANDIYDLSIAALGADAQAFLENEGDVAYDNVFAQHIVGLCADFLKIKANNIEAGTITANKLAFTPLTSNDLTGYAKTKDIPDVSSYITTDQAQTIANNVIGDYDFDFASETALNTLKLQVEALPTEQRVTEITGDFIKTGYLDAWGVTTLAATSTINTWALNADGSGHIAGGKFKWKADGTIIAQPDVTISWGDIDGKPTDLMTTSTNITKDQISTGLITADKISTIDFSAKNLTVSGKLSVNNLDITADYINSLEITANSIVSAASSEIAKGAAFNLSGNSFSFGGGALTGNDSELKIEDANIYITTANGSIVDIDGFCGYGLVVNGPGSSTMSCYNAAVVGVAGNLAYAIQSVGDMMVSGSVTSFEGFFQSSDETLKDFHNDVEIDFEKLKYIPKKYFTWKGKDSELQLGTSAQKVQRLYPELVNGGEKLSVDYAKLSIIALAAIDKLYDELLEVKRELNELKNK